MTCPSSFFLLDNTLVLLPNGQPLQVDHWKRDLDPAYVKCIDVSLSELLDLNWAADYMGMDHLLELSCAAMVALLQGKTTNELRSMFGYEVVAAPRNSFWFQVEDRSDPQQRKLEQKKLRAFWAEHRSSGCWLLMNQADVLSLRCVHQELRDVFRPADELRYWVSSSSVTSKPLHAFHSCFGDVGCLPDLIDVDKEPCPLGYVHVCLEQPHVPFPQSMLALLVATSGISNNLPPGPEYSHPAYIQDVVLHGTMAMTIAIFCFFLYISNFIESIPFSLDSS